MKAEDIKVVKGELSDGSKTYDVEIKMIEYLHNLLFYCVDEEAAHDLAEALETCVVDINTEA